MRYKTQDHMLGKMRTWSREARMSIPENIWLRIWVDAGSAYIREAITEAITSRTGE